MRSREGNGISYINFVSLRVKVDAATTLVAISSLLTWKDDQ